MTGKVVVSHSIEETQAVARRLAQSLNAGEFVVLSGPLGAGKTVFAAAVIDALGVKTRVTSPTFTMIAEYHGRYRVYHIDLYRLTSEEEVDTLDLDESLYGDGISLVEWAERAPFLFQEATVIVRIEPAPDQEANVRLITIRWRENHGTNPRV